jgi:hypothetical protein
MGDAMMNRPIIARRETVLRHRGRNSTRKQRSHKRETFQDGHDYPPKRAYALTTCSFRTPTRSPVYDGLVCSVIIAPCAPVDPAPGVPFKRPKCGAMSASGPKRTFRLRRGMSASLIGRLGSSTFRLSTATVSMSLTGSCFSSESAPRPFHHGIRGRSGQQPRANKCGQPPPCSRARCQALPEEANDTTIAVKKHTPPLARGE